MSVRIGEVLHSSQAAAEFRGKVATHVHASTDGVELSSDALTVLDPTQARNYAALLVRGANEVERMRKRAGRPAF